MTKIKPDMVNGDGQRGFFRPHAPVDLEFPDDGMTRQEFAEECDINVIMAKYGDTGFLPENPRQMQYGDFADVPDFMTAMNIVNRAIGAFADLPANVRKRFSNDPAEFCDFVADPANIDEVRRLGLAIAVPDLPKEGDGGVPPPEPPAGDKAPSGAA